MKIENILNKVDYTALNQTTTQKEIETLCKDGIKYNVASVCVPPFYAKETCRFLKGKLPITTVIGFPNGYNTTKTKLFETENALIDGANEIDMVINITALKNKNHSFVLNEISEIKQLCGENILKVIIETCLLSDEEKITMCKIVSDARADYIKTSTGFSTNGATKEDIKLFKKHIDSSVKIKAAGGISTLKQAEELILLGADRIGSSRIIHDAKLKMRD